MYLPKWYTLINIKLFLFMKHLYAFNRFNICIILLMYFICSKQLYEAEDNSFYSEAIFNAGYLFQMLQVCSQLNFIVMIQL